MLETVARLIVEPRDALVHQEHEQINTDGGLAALNEVMEFDPDLFWRLKENLRSFHIRGFNGPFEIDFRVTTHNHLRSVPFSSGKDRFRILAVGDSCTFGVGVNDEQTWSAQLQSVISEHGVAVEVVNAGVPGYTAYQGKCFLEKTGLAMRPDLIVCCFGVNDGDTWASRSDFETARLLLLTRFQSRLMHSRLFLGLKRTVQRAAFREIDAAIQRPRLTPSEFNASLQGIKQLCDENNIQLVLLVWPFAEQIALRDARLVTYQMLTPLFGEKEDVPVVNLVPAFLAVTEHSFVDHIHANEAGCRATAVALSDVIVPLLNSTVR